MLEMPRPRPLYLHRYVTRHGKVTWYVRLPGCKRVRIRAEYGTPGFDEAYRCAANGEEMPTKPRAATGSLQWLWERYRETDAWKHLSRATRRQRENIMVHVLKSIGVDPADSLTKKEIAASRDRRSGTPSQARNFLDCMRGLYGWAVEAEHVTTNPAIGVKNPAKASGEGFPVWTEEEVDQYHERWPLGTRQRVWIDVLLYTGLRRGDAVKLGWQHVRNGVATIRTEKSQRDIAVTIPILPALSATLLVGPCGDKTFIAGESGKPLTKESFGNMFREACRAAKIEKSAHGIRKATATRAANNGATDSEMKAVFGWVSSAMPQLYTRSADRAGLAKRAMSKLERPNPICSPSQRVSTADEK